MWKWQKYRADNRNKPRHHLRVKMSSILFYFYPLLIFFFLFLFLSNLYSQRGAWTQDPKIKHRMLYTLSQPGAPKMMYACLGQDCLQNWKAHGYSVDLEEQGLWSISSWLPGSHFWVEGLSAPIPYSLQITHSHKTLHKSILVAEWWHYAIEGEAGQVMVTLQSSPP